MPTKSSATKEEIGNEIKIAEMSKDIAHLAAAFDEFKNDTKEFHRTQTQQNDELSRKWQEIGGYVKGLADIQSQINENTRWIDENKEMISDIRQDRADNKKRVVDYVWRFGWVALGLGLTIYNYIVVSHK